MELSNSKIPYDRQTASIRLKKVDREVSLETAAKFINAGVVIAQFFLSRTRKKKLWILAPIVSIPYLVMNATLNRAPIVKILRKMGLRSKAEIIREKEQLKRFI